MPLTEQEQRAFEEIARQMGDPEHHRARRTMAAGTIGVMVGLAVVVASFAASVWVALGGYLVMLTSSLAAVRAWRQVPAPQWAAAGAARLRRSWSA